MRISADPTDAAFNLSVAQFCVILLDGVRQLRVLTADDELGYLKRYIASDEAEQYTAEGWTVSDVDDAPDAPIKYAEKYDLAVDILLTTKGARCLAMPNYSRTEQWLAACGKQPGPETLSVQVGVHLEEMSEFLEQLEMTSAVSKACHQSVLLGLTELARMYKKEGMLATFKDKVKALDALCDTDVTGNGVAYLAGFNKLEADRRVLEANDRKFGPDGPIILEGGKIGKPEGWKPADLSDCV